MKRALFFDLDGTLWDALIPLTDSWNNAMEKEKLPYRFDLKKMQSYMGLTPIETCPLAFPGTSLKEGMKLFKIVLHEEIEYLSKHPGKLYDGEEGIIKELSLKYPLYVISNADKGYIDNYFNACHMGKYYKGKLCAGDTNKDKWENIQLMMKKEKIDEVIYIGDTLKDMNESKKAGVHFIHAAYGFGEIKNVRYKIDNIKDLPKVVEEVFK